MFDGAQTFTISLSFVITLAHLYFKNYWTQAIFEI